MKEAIERSQPGNHSAARGSRQGSLSLAPDCNNKMPMQLDHVRRIYVRAPNWVGDLVMATSAFRRVREAFPEAHICCGVRPFLRPLLSGASWFDEYLDVPKARGVRGLLRQVRELKDKRCDLAIVLPNSLETGLVPFLARVPLRLGYRQGRPFLMNLGLRARSNRKLFVRHGPRRIPKPMPFYYEDLLDELGLARVDVHPVLAITADERRFIDAWLAQRAVPSDARIALLNAGANYGGSKLWEPERWTQLALLLRARGLTPIFLAGPNDKELVQKIAGDAQAIAAVDPVLPVDTLKPLVERAALMVTTDAGPRHIAVAFHVPVVCLMGPNDPRYTSYCLDESIVIRKELPCSPCQLKVCPLGRRNCMKFITVDEVVAAADQLLARFPRAT